MKNSNVRASTPADYPRWLECPHHDISDPDVGHLSQLAVYPITVYFTNVIRPSSSRSTLLRTFFIGGTIGVPPSSIVDDRWPAVHKCQVQRH